MLSHALTRLHSGSRVSAQDQITEGATRETRRRIGYPGCSSAAASHDIGKSYPRYDRFAIFPRVPITCRSSFVKVKA
jgi:hypothetical protein